MTTNYANTYPGFSSAVLYGRRFLYTQAGDIWQGYYCDDPDTGYYAPSRDQLLQDAMGVTL